MKQTIALLLLQFAAFWPVWQWYAKRFAAGNPDDQWCLLAAITAVIFLWNEREISSSNIFIDNPSALLPDVRQVSELPGRFLSFGLCLPFQLQKWAQPKTQRVSSDQAEPDRTSGGAAVSSIHKLFTATSSRKHALQRSWFFPALLMLFYAVTFHWLPPLLRAMIAMTAIGVTISQCLCGRALRPAIAGLFAISLPVIPLLQFYLGYPLRVIVGSVTAPLLQLSGLAVVREGTSLNWNGQLISIDAPCSGIKMLWAGFFLCCAVAWFYRLSTSKTLLAGLISLVVIVVGNILRASSLFYLEAGIIHLPINTNLAHDGVGIVTFVFTAIGIAASAHWLQQLPPTKAIPLCETSPRSLSPVS